MAATPTDIWRGLFNGTEADRAIIPNNTSSFCKLTRSRLAVAGGKLYIDGGSLALYPKNNFSTASVFTEINNRLLWIDLNTPFNQTNFKLNYATKPLQALTEAGEAYVPNIFDDKFYIFGGSYPTGNKSSAYYQEPPEHNTGDLWSYSGLEKSWKIETSNSSKVQRIADGAGSADYIEGVIYYAQGQYNNKVVRGFPNGVLPVDGLLSLSTLNPQPAWKNQTIRSGASVINGFLQYVPLGKRGVLIWFGGLRFPQGTFNGGEKLRDMNEVDIYDIETGSWHTQTASGAPKNQTSIPENRWDGCSVMAPSPDNSSYNIYMCGGQNGSDGEYYDDVWVLLIPSFIWVKVYQGPGGGGAQSCARAGRFMFQAGIVRPGSCDALFHIFDMVGNKWNEITFDAKDSYEVSLDISDAIGGGSNGGATRRTPLHGWSKEVEGIFSASRASGPGPAGPSSGNRVGLGPSKIAGIVVGICVLAAVAAGIFYLMRLRHRRDNVTAETENTQLPELPGITNGAENLAEAPGSHAHELSDTGLIRSNMAS